jgi:molybdopterin molybdotransferase
MEKRLSFKDMLGRDGAISVDNAKKLLFENVKAVGIKTEKLTILDSLCRIAAHDIHCPYDLPEFSRCTVDGYAVNAADTFGASESMPAYLTVSAEILMGQKAHIALKKGTAHKIATGGMLPDGADAVIMFEHTTMVGDETIEITKSVAPGENVIQKGEDIAKGAMVIQSGRKLKPQDIGALAAIGITDIEVFKKPIVSIISTGDEIVPADSMPDEGQIRDSNSYYLFGAIQACGAIPIRKGILKDNFEDIYNTVKQALQESDIVIMTGGSSVGIKDMAERVVNSFEKPGVMVHGVLMKPGKPTLFGFSGQKPIFGLPGHPAAVAVSFETFVKPLIKMLSGHVEAGFINETVKARLSKNIASRAGRQDCIRVTLQQIDGELVANPLLGKSGLITTLVKADGIIAVPEFKTGLYEGEIVDVALI